MIKWRPNLQRFLLNRGQWALEDLRHVGITGFQIANGDFDKSFQEGLKQWITLLLEGEKKFIYAGNDSHGNFNRYHQIKHPMISLSDQRVQIMGKCRTGILLQEEPSINTIIDALKKGDCIISNGPLARMEIRNQSSSYTLGESVDSKRIEISIDLISSPEFGKLKKFKLLLGDLDKKEETPIIEHDYVTEKFQDNLSTQVDASFLRGYVRAQLVSSLSSDQELACYTNPIWINH